MSSIPPHDASHGAEQASAAAASAADESRLMAELSIIRGGRHYFYDGYSYDRLADAIAYAQLVGGQTRRTGSSSPVQRALIDSPTAADLQLMRELSISFESGCFVYAGFRYDRLIDAANYARHRRSLAATPKE